MIKGEGVNVSQPRSQNKIFYCLNFHSGVRERQACFLLFMGFSKSRKMIRRMVNEGFLTIFKAQIHVVSFYLIHPENYYLIFELKEEIWKIGKLPTYLQLLVRILKQ